MLRLVTVATPIRRELADVYRSARLHVEHWTHLRSGGADRRQRWGVRGWRDWLYP